MKRTSFIGGLLVANLLMACSGNTTDNANTNKPGDSVTVADNKPAPTTESCWQAVAKLEGMGAEVRVTPNGGAKVVFTNWDETMNALSQVFCQNFPYDAPFKEEEIRGLLGKVKGLCVKGNPMNPFLFLQLEDGKVQLYSIAKMMTHWSFWAGYLIAEKQVREIREVTREFLEVEAVLENGSVIKDDDFVTPIMTLHTYYKDFVNPADSKFCNFYCELDGSLSYVENNQNFDNPKIYYGALTAVAKKGTKTTYDYVLTCRSIDGKDIPMNSKGQFSCEPARSNGRVNFTPISGLNIFSVCGEKIGQFREVVVGDNKWDK